MSQSSLVCYALSSHSFGEKLPSLSLINCHYFIFPHFLLDFAPPIPLPAPLPFSYHPLSLLLLQYHPPPIPHPSSSSITILLPSLILLLADFIGPPHQLGLPGFILLQLVHLVVVAAPEVSMGHSGRHLHKGGLGHSLLPHLSYLIWLKTAEIP